MNQTKKHTTGKKLLALLLALIMSVSLLPMSVFAAEMGAETPVVEGQTQQDAVPDKSGGEEEIVDSQESVAEDPAPVQEDTTEDVDTLAMEDEAAVQADDSIYTQVEEGKAKSLPAPAKNKMDYRIVHIDCGRKYFSADDLKKIIDYAYEYGYTHVELAFGNDGLRFLLNDMSVDNYTSDQVSTAIRAGNDAFDRAAGNSSLAAETEELNESEMNEIIAYANGKGIGIIPMFDAPGHLYAVITAMRELGLTVNYSNPSYSGSSPNWAINPTDTASISFVQTLMQKYITYFAGKGCTMFNIAADECGFSNMNNNTYTAYAKLVNSMAAMVQNAGMVALAFNDGINHANLTSDVQFDTNIGICYWTAGANYATAASLASNGFKIVNTNTHWYYVIGKENGNLNGDWNAYAYYLNYAVKNMSAANSAFKVDGDTAGAVTPVGCMAAVWCDNPSSDVIDDNLKNYVKALQDGNGTYFVKAAAPEVVSIVDSTGVAVSAMKVGDSVTLTLSNNAEASWSVDKTDVIELSATTRAAAVTGTSVTATALKAGTATVTATVDGTEYTQDITVTDAGDVAVTEEKITLTIGQISEKYTQDGHYGDVTDGELKNDAGVVVATYTSKNETGSGVSFTPVTSVSADSSYYIKTANGYLTATGSTTDDVSQAAAWTWKYNSTSGSYTYGRFQLNSSYLCYSNGSFTTVSTNTSTYNTWVRFSNGQFLIYTGSSYSYELTPGTRTVEPAGDITTITFKGVAEGTTYVTIGHVKYTINVKAEDLSTATDLPIQFWITNNIIRFNEATTTSGTFGNGTYKNAYYKNIAATTTKGTEKVNSKDGMALSLLIPASRTDMKEYDNVYFDEDSQSTSITNDWSSRAGKELVLFQGVLHKNEVQFKLDKDYSNTGDVFQYVRYLGGKWSVSADRVNWVDVGTNLSKTTASSTSSGTQVVAYYMIRSTITQEITTDVADWGDQYPSSEYNSRVTSSDTFVLLDFAVKYEDNSQNPDKFPVDGKTFAFHCKANDAGGAVKQQDGYYYRELNNFRAVNTSDYEVYMVTVTMTSDTAGTMLTGSQAKTANGYTYDGEEQVLWAIDQETRDKFTLKDYASISGSTIYSGCKIGGDPYIRGVEVYRQHGALITYYVRAKTTVTDALTVHYLDRSADDFEFYNYPIVVKQSTFFDESFAQVKPNTTELTGNTVENHLGVTQTVTAELKDMPAIGAQYRYSDYVCVEVKRSDDGKDVYLYYTFNAIKTFVVDFGLPLTITTADINSNLDAVNKAGRLTKIVTNNSNYADVKTTNDYSIIYTLNKTIDGKDNVTATYFGTNAEGTENNVTYTLSIIPASTVYYEDSFAKFYDAGSNDAKTAFTATGDTDTMGTWYVDGNELTSMPDQALEELGNKQNVYGYDPAYNTNSTTFSMGSAKKVTVDATLDKAPTATFTFKGTGFDIISLTDNNSGAIVVNVKRTDTNTAGYKEYDENFLVNNYYGYKQVKAEDGTITWEVSDNKDPNALYQIPVMKVTGLNYGEYAVTINVGYGAIFDKTGDSQYSFWLDAVRVYNPMGEDRTEYTQGNEKEGYPQYIKLRDKLANNDGVIADKNIVFIDGGNVANIGIYTNYGPNNEVYLANGQAISFQVPENANIASIQIGAKAPQDSTNAANMSISVNGVTTKTEQLTSATEMYYLISDEVSGATSVTITNTTGSVLSLTNLKITFKAAQDTVTLAALSDEDQANAVAAVRALFAAPVEPEPDPEPATFAPDRFEVSWNRSTVKVGQKATLTVKTSEDVAAITVDGVTIDTYRTRTERTGWGWNAKKVTYREFTYTVTAAEAGTLDVSVAAVNAEGVSSAAVTATLTVQAASQRPGIGGWLDNIFGRWF